MFTGHIKHWNAAKGYGFIHCPDSEQDAFFHISQWQPTPPPKEGMTVYFALHTDHKGRLQAQNVNLEPQQTATQTTQAQPVTGLQRLWKQTLAVVALIFITLLLWKSVAPFFAGFNTEQALNPATGYSVELEKTLALIQQGGPYPYRQDNQTFQNRERLLPERTAGYYREYTVRTPHARDRGARRVVTGGHPPTEYYYTEDHYRSFIRLEVSP